jgi:hypothetical protein
MRWRITNDVLHETNGHVICTFSPDIDPFYSRLIKKTPEIIDLAFEFKEFCEAGKKITKKLHDKLYDLIEENHTYNFSWDIDKDGNLKDHSGKVICFFPEKNSTDSILIRFVPEVLKAIKENWRPFTRSNANQKPLNQSLIKVLRRIDEY